MRITDEPCPPEIPGRLTRRDFLGILASSIGLGGMAIAGLDLEGTADKQNRKAEVQSGFNELNQIEASSFETDLSHTWNKAVVWPGTALVKSSAQLYRSPELATASQISWPDSKRQQALLLERPIIAAATNYLNTGSKQPTIKPDVLGFWLPDLNTLAFCDYQADRDVIELSDQRNQVDHGSHSLLGQTILLQPAHRLRNSNMRFSDNQDPINSEANHPDEDGQPAASRAIGCSYWIHN